MRPIGANLNMLGRPVINRKTLFSVIAGLCAPTLAHAQDAGNHMHLSASSRLSYDNNILGTNDPTLARPGLAKEDFKFTPFVTVDVAAPFGRHNTFLSGSLGYDFNRRNKNLDRENINVSGGVNLRPTNDCTVGLSTKFARQQSDITDYRTFVSVSNTEQRVGFDGDVNCKPGLGLTSSLGYGFEKVENSDIGRSSGEYLSNTISASLGYQRKTLGELSVYASYRRGSYPNRGQLLRPNSAERVRVVNTGLRFSRDIGTALKGTASVGYVSVDPNTPGVPSFKGASYSADLTWRLSESFKGIIGIARDVQQSNTLDISYSIVDRYQFSASYELSRQVDLVFGAGRSKRSFRESPLIPAAFLRGKDSTTNFFAGARYNPPGRVSYSVDVSASDRNSAARQFGYNKMIASLTVRYGF
jgi:hypothetical protein